MKLKYNNMHRIRKVSLSKPVISSNDSLKFSLKIPNIGRQMGAEVLQLYISDKECSIERPVKELKYFKKVWLKPGESKQVAFNILPKDLTFWSENKHGWKIKPRTCEILLGSSSKDIRQHQFFDFNE